jgi:hypothetical protein
VRIGELELLVEDAHGCIVERITLTTTAASPGPGDEIEIDGRVFIVRRVSHQAEGPTHQRTTRRYLWTKLHVRAFGLRSRRARDHRPQRNS